MGYAHYEITRNGETIEAGYAVEAVCEEDGCTAEIDRGLGFLCGQDPGGDERGCGGYFCSAHLTYSNQCKRCARAADEANTWVNPGTGEEFDLRDRFLPAGRRYDARGTVWVYGGEMRVGVPLLKPVHASTGEPAPGERSWLLTEGEWQDAARVAYRQMHETAKGA